MNNTPKAIPGEKVFCAQCGAKGDDTGPCNMHTPVHKFQSYPGVPVCSYCKKPAGQKNECEFSLNNKHKFVMP